MPNPDYAFIHPLLGKDELWSAFLLETTGADGIDESLLETLGQHPNLGNFDHRLHWFVPAALEMTIPDQFKPQIVCVFGASPDSDQQDWQALEQDLRQEKTKLALRTSGEGPFPVSGAWNFLVFSCAQARSLPAGVLQGEAGRSQIVVSDIHSEVDFIWAKNSACSLFTAEFQLKHQAPGKKIDLTRLKLLQLLSLIVADADTAEIEAILRQEPKLAYSLLRLVNSAANAPRQPITSFSQAINLLGRRQLQRWVQLLVYASPNNEQQANPLLQKAATRGRLLELLAVHLHKGDGEIEQFRDLAFMAGTFSLLHILLNMPMKEILQHLPLPEMLHSALAEQTGALGEALKALDAAEGRNLLAAQQELQTLAIDPAIYLDAQLAALHWAMQISLAE